MIVKEIEDAKRLVKTDAYQMSVGELVNMYKDGELIINPDFQRLFRWEIGQKSKLIESILLGIHSLDRNATLLVEDDIVHAHGFRLFEIGDAGIVAVACTWRVGDVEYRSGYSRCPA
jgi:hypothetical protein